MNRFSFPRVIGVGVLALVVLVAAAVPASASSRPVPTERAGLTSAGTVLGVPAGSVLSVRGAGPYRIGARLQAL